MRIHSSLIVVLALALTSACASRPTLPPGEIVGMEMKPSEVVHLSVIEANPEPFWNQTLLIEATVVAVCQNSGCWMQIEDEGSRAMVRWEGGCGGEYSFPKDLSGRRIVIQGSIYKKSFAEEEVEHLEEEAGRKLSIASESQEIKASSILVLGEPN